MGHYNAGSNNLGSRNSGSGNMGDMNAGGCARADGGCLVAALLLQAAAPQNQPCCMPLCCACPTALRSSLHQMTCLLTAHPAHPAASGCVGSYNSADGSFGFEGSGSLVAPALRQHLQTP